MTGLATKETERSVTAFIESIDSEAKRNDAFRLLGLISEVTGYEAKVWGNDRVPDFLIGFGKYRYTRKGSKEEYEWFNVGFAPRKSKTTVYLTLDIGQHKDLLENLGKCKWGKGCLYINKLDDVDIDVLRELIAKSAISQWHQA